MQAIFLDNFRGFTKTVIPLSDVNFFVGQNSTGKSSVLAILALLEDPNFWFSQEFNSSPVELGYFDDIRSQGSTSDVFSIGVFFQKRDAKEKGSAFAMLRFKSQKNIPMLCEFRYEQSGYEIIIALEGPRIRYAIRPCACGSAFDLSSFKKIVLKGPPSRSEFKSVRIKVRGPFPIPVLINIIGNELETQKKNIGWKTSMPFDLDQNFCWIAPIRAKPKRTYDSYKVSNSPEGEHIPYLLKTFLAKALSKKRANDIATIKRFGIESGLFEAVSTKPYINAPTSPFEVHVTLKGQPFRISNVGYGVSQALPILVESIARHKGALFAIQQPEVHLHPRAQAALGGLIFHLAAEESKKFIIETHSDYLIDRFRLGLANRRKLPKPSSQVVFFDRERNGNRGEIISIDQEGRYSERQPKTFRDFFIKEELRLVSL